MRRHLAFGLTASGGMLYKAFPTRLTGADLKSGGSEVAAERIEIAYKILTLAKA